jgi:hypothetical protein
MDIQWVRLQAGRLIDTSTCDLQVRQCLLELLNSGIRHGTAAESKVGELSHPAQMLEPSITDRSTAEVEEDELGQALYVSQTSVGKRGLIETQPP